MDRLRLRHLFAANGRTVIVAMDHVRTLAAGAAGVAIGRDPGQHPDPEGVSRALVGLVYGGATVEKTLRNVQ